MIYFLYGGDKDRAREKAHELMDALVKKRPDASVFRLTPDQWSDDELRRLSEGMGLFQSNYIVFLDNVFENPDAEEAVLESLAGLEESQNVFILLEGEPLKAVRDKIEKRASKSQEFAAKKQARKEFNNFALADAFGNRDKKELWALFREAIDQGKAPEELHGVISWQARSCLAARNAQSATESGLKPFVHSKSLRYAGNYPGVELPRKSSELVELYHEARRGGEDMEVALEKWILGL